MYSINIVLGRKDLNPASKIVYLYLQEKAYSNREEFNLLKNEPEEVKKQFIRGTSMREIAEGTGITTRTVARCIDALEEVGLIEKIRQTTEIGTTSLNRYKVFENYNQEIIAEV